MTDAVGGPHFDELSVGQVFDSAPALTLTAGHAALHQAIVGDRLRLPLDDALSAEVLDAAPMAHPALVWDVAIGQSSVVTHRVVANLFYRGLVFSRAPMIGDTLHTRTEIVGLRQNSRRSTGLAALRITTVDQHDRPVLDFVRCAMLPLRDETADTGQHADLAGIGPDTIAPVLPAGWRLAAFRDRVPGPHFADLRPGRTWEVHGGNVVSAAPELAGLTLNVATVHHDAESAGGRRLVFGGHTIGLALSQASRALPAMVTVLGWHGCDHTGPVYEGDTLRSTVEVQRTEPLPGGGGLAHLRSLVRSEHGAVLDWTYVAVLA